MEVHSCNGVYLLDLDHLANASMLHHRVVPNVRHGLSHLVEVLVLLDASQVGNHAAPSALSIETALNVGKLPH